MAESTSVNGVMTGFLGILSFLAQEPLAEKLVYQKSVVFVSV